LWAMTPWVVAAGLLAAAAWWVWPQPPPTYEQRVAKAEETLKRNPEDRAANDLLGRHWCFREADWSRGLPHLAKGGAVGLSAAARQELELRESTAERNPGDFIRLASRWWALGNDDSPRPEKEALVIKQHARDTFLEWVDQLVSPTDINYTNSWLDGDAEFLAFVENKRPGAVLIAAPPVSPIPDTVDSKPGDQSLDDLFSTRPVVDCGRLREGFVLPNGWVLGDGFIEGKGQVAGRGKRAVGDPSALYLTNSLDAKDFQINLVLSVEKVGGTAAQLVFRANREVGTFGLDGRNKTTFVEGSLFRRPEPQPPPIALKQGEKLRITMRRRGEEVLWSVEDQEVATVQLTQASLESFAVVPLRGHLRIYEASVSP
jgi:hypothetical protein